MAKAVKTQSELDSEKLAAANVAARQSLKENKVKANDEKIFDSHGPATLDADGVTAHLDAHAPTLAAMVNNSVAAEDKPSCAAVYAASRAVLVLVKDILFFKPKWKQALEALIVKLDEAFPTAVR